MISFGQKVPPHIRSRILRYSNRNMHVQSIYATCSEFEEKNKFIPYILGSKSPHLDHMIISNYTVVCDFMTLRNYYAIITMSLSSRYNITQINLQTTSFYTEVMNTNVKQQREVVAKAVLKRKCDNYLYEYLIQKSSQKWLLLCYITLTLRTSMNSESM